jgi:two-component system, OmpR family, response regulator ChvI
MKAIARGFGAEVVAQVGNLVEFYFPRTSESSSDKTPFKDVLGWGIIMQAAHSGMNQKCYEEYLPPINYRISADYGGPTLNICAKINVKAPPNRMVIGKNLYDMINDSLTKLKI